MTEASSTGYFLSEILKITLPSGLLIASISWLSREIIRQWLDKSTEEFRQKLQREKEVEAEKLRAELQRITMEHQIRFQQLHITQFEVIARIYKLIAKTQAAMHEYFQPFVPVGAPPELERGKAAVLAWVVLKNYFEEHEIYFNEDTASNIKKYIEGLRGLALKFQYKNYATEGSVSEWQTIWEGLNKNILPLKKKLAVIFRQKIGVEIVGAKSTPSGQAITD